MPSASPDTLLSLWDFSLLHYARPGVAEACLQLQDGHDANVNVLLWCAWLERRGLILDEVRLGNAQKRIRAWDEHYVIPLRHLRRRMKAEFGVADAAIEQLRTHIKQAELLAEKQLQLLLEAEAHTWSNDSHQPTYCATGCG
ncbi:MAG: TIGR02444 family protein [Rheinheimera sp.]|nr:TIGR02444 family protein [Rheinheimera sp.]